MWRYQCGKGCNKWCQWGVAIATISPFTVEDSIAKAIDYRFIRRSMKPNIFVTRLARSAAATALVGAGVIPPHQASAAVLPPVIAQEFTFPDRTILPEEDELQASTRGGFVLSMQQAPSEWDKKLDKEFRKLALAEANDTLSMEDATRLEQLSRWREQLLSPQTVTETLLQIKRDRLLVRMESLLQEYVELQEAANQKRSAA